MPIAGRVFACPDTNQSLTDASRQSLSPIVRTLALRVLTICIQWIDESMAFALVLFLSGSVA
jgi:hypothetical protein